MNNANWANQTGGWSPHSTGWANAAGSPWANQDGASFATPPPAGTTPPVFTLPDSASDNAQTATSKPIATSTAVGQQHGDIHRQRHNNPIGQLGDFFGSWFHSGHDDRNRAGDITPPTAVGSTATGGDTTAPTTTAPAPQGNAYGHKRKSFFDWLFGN
jgi:hypothetical protein